MAEPKRETARIAVFPQPAPTMAPPINAIQPAPVTPIDKIPRPLCWTALGISAVIFLIQIWNYVVS
ncbi:MAG TPA: hypothetical protein VH188_11920 [Chthoniobacterales bacterium]|jgi:hypothetical protein|nr:hypothetical protein [Chthoniobacterales bacterium]